MKLEASEDRPVESVVSSVFGSWNIVVKWSIIFSLLSFLFGLRNEISWSINTSFLID
jgi:hypothetical protein